MIITSSLVESIGECFSSHQGLGAFVTPTCRNPRIRVLWTIEIGLICHPIIPKYKLKVNYFLTSLPLVYKIKFSTTYIKDPFFPLEKFVDSYQSSEISHDIHNHDTLLVSEISYAELRSTLAKTFPTGPLGPYWKWKSF